MSTKENKYSFPSGKFYLNFQMAGIIGVPRSGKTTLGNLLATNKNVEYSEEPWLLGTLPAMVKFGIIDKEIGKDMFISYLHELMNDMVLLRAANFRPNDESSIWTKKTHIEIFSRLVNLHSRKDVKSFVKKNKPLFLMTMSEASLFNLSSIFDFLPDSKIIHVVRRGVDIASQTERRGHFSDEQLLNPPHARLYYPTKYKGRTFYVPCWVDTKDKKTFLEYSDYDRGLFFWCVLMEKAIESFEKLKNKKQYMTITFEDLIEHPREIMEKASAFLNIEPTFTEETALCKIQNYKNMYKKVPTLPKELFTRAKKIYTYFGYDWS